MKRTGILGLVVLTLVLCIGASPVQALTHLDLAAQGGAVAGRILPLEARLRDSQGAPIAGARVTIFEQTTFGRLILGNYTTNANGRVYGEFTPRSDGTFLLGASFAGDGVHEPAEATVQVNVSASPAAGGSDVLSYYILLGTIIAIVGSVWATYAFVVLQILLIPREAEPPGHDLGNDPGIRGGGGKVDDLLGMRLVGEKNG